MAGTNTDRDWSIFGQPGNPRVWCRPTHLPGPAQNDVIVRADQERLAFFLAPGSSCRVRPSVMNLAAPVNQFGWLIGGGDATEFSWKSLGPLVQAEWILAQSAATTIDVYEILDWGMEFPLNLGSIAKEISRVTALDNTPLAKRWSDMIVKDWLQWGNSMKPAGKK